MSPALLLFVSPREPLAPTLGTVSELLRRVGRIRPPRLAAVWVSDRPVPLAERRDAIATEMPASIEVTGRWRLDRLDVPGTMGDARDRLIRSVATTAAHGGVLLPVVGRSEPWRDVRRALRRWRARHGSVVGRCFIADDGNSLDVRAERPVASATDDSLRGHQAVAIEAEMHSPGGPMPLLLEYAVDDLPPAMPAARPGTSAMSPDRREIVVTSHAADVIAWCCRTRHHGRTFVVVSSDHPLAQSDLAQIASDLRTAPSVTVVLAGHSGALLGGDRLPSAPAGARRLLVESDTGHAVIAVAQWPGSEDRLVIIATDPAAAARLQALVQRAERWLGAWDDPEFGHDFEPLWHHHAGPVSKEHA